MVGSRQFGRYILVDRISTGGMAEVHLAVPCDPGGPSRAVAIKRILPTASEESDFEIMFVDEARISARLRHDNIGQVLEYGQVDGHYSMAM